MRRRGFLATTILTLAGSGTWNVRGAAGSGLLVLSPTPPHDGKGAFLLEAGESLRLAAAVNDPRANGSSYRRLSAPRCTWRCDAGRFDYADRDATVWRPPDSASTALLRCDYEARYRSSADRREVATRLSTVARVVVGAPSRLLVKGWIDGFHIGEYPDLDDPRYASRVGAAKRHRDAYAIPSAFYKVTRDNLNLYVSDNFTLGDFAHHYPWESLGLPQYIALDKRLIEKLEALLASLRRHGMARKKFNFIYGFRPPSYNLKARESDPMGNLKAPFSMHQYGKAADIIIDDDGNLVMDDLTGDKASSLQDAISMRKYVDLLDEDYLRRKDPRLGGAGVYARHDFRARKQSPYVHVDVRGFAGGDGRPVRWTSK